MTDTEPIVGEIYATRTFGVTREGSLTGLHHQDFVWADGENTAVCHASGPARKEAGAHRTPELKCRCGFYGYTMTSQTTPENQVLGVIACSGKTVAGDLGLRAEKARIVALFFGDAVPWKAKREVEKNYPSAEIFEDRDQLVEAYGLVVEPVPNAGTFEGFKKPTRKWDQRKLASLKRAQQKRASRGPIQDLRIIAGFFKIAIVLALSVGLLLSSPVASSWLAPWTEPGLIGEFSTYADRFEASPGAGILAFILANFTVWVPVLLTLVYLSGMSGTPRQAVRGYAWVVAVLVSSAGSAASLFWYFHSGPAAVMTVASLCWLATVGVLVGMLVRISFAASAIRTRANGKSYFAQWRRQLVQELGVFVYAPTTGPAIERRTAE